ncbi:hypothetical protein LOD99_4883 [Oopsacas minuta]|uniref:Vacuolar fusion protein CCZ1 n=1 Tax=Oopsacas minuta TaxID=111878 RepID=A0AAV7JRK2_9METZ|nr:hypothetical protein LOD99_4883 [Oopsacas minuta]
MEESPAEVMNFCIFNTELGLKEGLEHEKIMYFYGLSTQTTLKKFTTTTTGASNGITQLELDGQIKQIGLAEAMIQFSSTFSDDGCHFIHTKKTRQVIYNPEPNYIMKLTVSVPSLVNPPDPGNPFYMEDSVQDSLLDAIIKQSYTFFTFFNRSYTEIFTQCGVEGLKECLSDFYDKFWSSVSISNLSLLNLFQGIVFLPLGKNPFLRVHSFVSCIEASFPIIKYTVFCYSYRMVWCSLEQKYMRIVYRYLTDFLMPACFDDSSSSYKPKALGKMKPSSQWGSISGRSTSTSIRGNMQSGYIIGPNNIKDIEQHISTERVYIMVDDCLKTFYFVVYHAYNITLCLFLESEDPPLHKFYQQLHQCLSAELATLAQELNENSTSSSSDAQYKFLYCNNMNLAVKSTLHSVSYPYEFQASNELMRLLADMHDDFECSKHGEIFIRTRDDTWVVGRRSDQREFFVVLYYKNATLMNVHEEIRKITNEQFTNVFFVD